MKKALFVLLTAVATGVSAAAAAEDWLAPFVAEYDVKYGSLPVGSSRTKLFRAAAPNQWVIELRSTASGLAKLIASGTLAQHSSFELDATGLRPLSYRFDDGTKRRARDVELQFDWHNGRITGTAEGSTVDLPVAPGLQDAASIQASVLFHLRRGAEPGTIAMIEKDRVKHYDYTLLRRERLPTTLGVVDTVVYRSARDGSGRETLFWYAPALGYVTVKAEQRREGKRLFQTYIRRFQPGA